MKVYNYYELTNQNYIKILYVGKKRLTLTEFSEHEINGQKAKCKVNWPPTEVGQIELPLWVVKYQMVKKDDYWE